MKALVTGGTGFLGAHIVRELIEQGHSVTVLHRHTSRLDALEGLEYESRIGDINDHEVVKEAARGCDWLFHVAAVSDYWRQDTDRLYQVNVEGTETVLQAAMEASVRRVIFTSTVGAIGVGEHDQIMDETHHFNLRPEQFPYGHSKSVAETKVRHAVALGQDVVIVNPTIVIGPRDLNMISGSIIIEAARGLARFYLPGGADYVAVEDVAKGHILAAERGISGERYILGGENVTHSSVIEMVVDELGLKRPKMTIPAWMIRFAASAVDGARKILGNRIPFDGNQMRLSVRTLQFSSEKARSQLGYQTTPLRAAVVRAINWYKEHDYID
ncbi:MAG: SDR family oxidoreductase [Chloroflexota bacterium]